MSDLELWDIFWRSFGWTNFNGNICVEKWWKIFGGKLLVKNIWQNGKGPFDWEGTRLLTTTSEMWVAPWWRTALDVLSLSCLMISSHKVLCVFVSLCPCVFVPLCLCVPVSLCPCVFVFLCLCAPVSLCPCVFVYLCPCAFVTLCLPEPKTMLSNWSSTLHRFIYQNTLC